MEQSEHDIREIGRRRELPPDEPYGAGEDELEPDEHDCRAATRIVRVYQERREVCCVCGRVVRTVIAP